jgi:tetratricopeptide (TPR) repeat protein
VALPIALAVPAAAQPIGWREHVDPARRLALGYRQEGLLRLLQAMSPDVELSAALGSPPRWLLLDQALLRFERAARLTPDDPELAYYRAVALTRYERNGTDGSAEYRSDEAIEALQRVRELDPTFLPDRVAYELAMLHMRAHDFERARAEYETALRESVPAHLTLIDRQYPAAATEYRLAQLFTSLDVANLHGNLAEAAMLTGDVESALEHYRAALATSDDPITRALAQWGLALALERSGAHTEALQAATLALRADPVAALGQRPDFARLSQQRGPFAVLYLPFVFFEPPSERHAYEALGHEALARADGATVDAEQLREAVQAWRLFLAAGGNASRYAPIARSALDRLERELAPPAPSPPTTRRARARR